MKYFIHLDGDCFFVQCELMRYPEYKGKPVVVGQERGIVTALSYEAKALGIKRGDPIYQIKDEYKEVVILQSHFDIYNKYCDMLVDILHTYTDQVEVYSVDECFMILDTADLYGDTIENVMRNIRDDIYNKTGIIYSVGVSYNKVLAKLASKHEKPKGLTFFLDKNKIENIYKNKKCGDIWGIGRATERSLNKMGVIYIDQFKNLDEKLIKRNFTKPIIELWREINYEVRMNLNLTHNEYKSMIASRSFTYMTNDYSILSSELSRNIEHVFMRLNKYSLFTNSFTIYIKTHDRDMRNIRYMSKTIELDKYTNDVSVALNISLNVLADIIDENYIYKATGITLHNLIREEGITNNIYDLFEQATCDSKVDNRENKSNKLDDLMLTLRNKFGNDKVVHATSLLSINKRKEQSKDRDDRDNHIYNTPLPYLGLVS